MASLDAAPAVVHITKIEGGFIMSTKTTKSYMTIAHVIIMFALMFGIGKLQPFGTVTPMGMNILGIFVGTLYGWLFLDLLWPSLLASGWFGYDRLHDRW